MVGATTVGGLVFTVATSLLLVASGWLLGDTWATIKMQRAHIKKEREAFIRYYKALKAKEAHKARTGREV